MRERVTGRRSRSARAHSRARGWPLVGEHGEVSSVAPAAVWPLPVAAQRALALGARAGDRVLRSLAALGGFEHSPELASEFGLRVRRRPALPAPDVVVTASGREQVGQVLGCQRHQAHDMPVSVTGTGAFAAMHRSGLSCRAAGHVLDQHHDARSLGALQRCEPDPAPDRSAPPVGRIDDDLIRRAVHYGAELEMGPDLIDGKAAIQLGSGRPTTSSARSPHISSAIRFQVLTIRLSSTTTTPTETPSTMDDR